MSRFSNDTEEHMPIFVELQLAATSVVAPANTVVTGPQSPLRNSL